MLISVIKILLNDKIEYAEVQFYFLHYTTHNAGEKPTPYAVVSVYSQPVQSILEDSSNTLWACHYTGVDNLQVIHTSTITACVSMQPLPLLPTDPVGLWFVLEKSGLEDVQLTGIAEPMEDNRQ